MSNSTTFMLSRSHGSAWQRNQNTVRHSLSSKEFGPVAHTVIVVLLLCVMGLMYLTQINKTNAYTYPINNLQAKKDSLIAEQQQLKVEAARLGSLDTIKKSAMAGSMTTAAKTQTIR